MALTRIPSTQITDNAVTTAKIDDATVIGTDIVDGTITNTMVDASAAIAHTKLAVGTAAPLNVGTSANQILQLNGSGVLPALDGTQLTDIQTDFSPLERQLARLALHIGAVEQLTKFSMIDQCVDNYEDASGITAYNAVDAIDAVAALGDYSSSAYTVTAVGNAAASTTEKKIGTHAVVFDGTGDYLQVNNLFDLDDFTIELWMYNTESNSNAHIIGNCNHTTGAGGGWGLYCNGDGKIKFNSYGNSWNTGDVSTGWSTSTWHHVAVTRSGNAVKMFLDGVQKYSGTPSSATLGGGTNLGIGSDNGVTSSMDFVGYMDEIRISNTARYTSAFTPSTTAFTSDANTKLLIRGEGQSAVPAVPNTGSSQSAK